MKRAVFGLVRLRLWNGSSDPSCCLNQLARIYSPEKIAVLDQARIGVCNVGYQPGMTGFSETVRFSRQ